MENNQVKFILKIKTVDQIFIEDENDTKLFLRTKRL